MSLRLYDHTMNNFTQKFRNQYGFNAGISRFGFAKNVHSKFPELSFMNPVSAKADSVIVLWMAGGPSQFETFNPKPNSKNGGSTKAIQTNVPGILLSENLPLLTQQMDKITLVRHFQAKKETITAQAI
jgi:hypothetical protein